jgi:hypothetical protein
VALRAELNLNQTLVLGYEARNTAVPERRELGANLWVTRTRGEGSVSTLGREPPLPLPGPKALEDGLKVCTQGTRQRRLRLNAGVSPARAAMAAIGDWTGWPLEEAPGSFKNCVDSTSHVLDHHLAEARA